MQEIKVVEEEKKIIRRKSISLPTEKWKDLTIHKHSNKIGKNEIDTRLQWDSFKMERITVLSIVKVKVKQRI